MEEEKARLTAEEIEAYMMGVNVDTIVGHVAERVGYNPVWYGMYRAEIVETKNGLYAKWLRSSSCD